MARKGQIKRTINVGTTGIVVWLYAEALPPGAQSTSTRYYNVWACVDLGVNTSVTFISNAATRAEFRSIWRGLQILLNDPEAKHKAGTQLQDLNIRNFFSLMFQLAGS